MSDKNATEQVKDLQGVEGEGDIYISGMKKKYKILPCPLKELATLQEKLSQWQNIRSEETSAMLDNNSVNIMAEIIHLGLKHHHSDLTVEKCKEEFSLSDFPKILKIMMDLNDFLLGMREIATVQSLNTTKGK